MCAIYKIMSIVDLYGLRHSSRSKEEHWGKNQFNSSFPTALLCWMRDQDLPLLQIESNENLELLINESPVKDVFCGIEPENTYFDFESQFVPFQRYLTNPEELQGADMTVAQLDKNPTSPLTQIRPFEIKLTVVPDHTTCDLPENEWAPEIVIRPSTPTYIALGLYKSAENDVVVQDFASSIHCKYTMVKDWNDEPKAIAFLVEIAEEIKYLISNLSKYQLPFLLNPIWKTKGKSPDLNNQALDCYVWTNLALFARISKEQWVKGKTFTRFGRAVLLITRLLLELSTSAKTDLRKVIKDSQYSRQSDKSWAWSGTKNLEFMRHPRLVAPIVKKEQLNEIIRNDGYKNLSPERRFDASVVYTCQELFARND